MGSYLEVNQDFPNLGQFVSVMDQQSNSVSRLDTGKGTGLEQGQFISPHSIAFEGVGDLYAGDVVDADRDKVRHNSVKSTNREVFNSSKGWTRLRYRKVSGALFLCFAFNGVVKNSSV